MRVDQPCVSVSETFEEVVDRRLGRRGFLKGALSAAPLLAITPELFVARRADAAPTDALGFIPVPLDGGTEVLAAPGYDVQKFLRWGDPILPGAPAFNFFVQTPAAQAGQFGYNCDFLQYFPLPNHRSQNSNRGLLCVNHEYTNPELMFPNFTPGGGALAVTTAANVAIELMAHGLSIVEVELDRRQNAWSLVVGSYNRRVTGQTIIELTGPAAGHPLLRTSGDPTGTRVRGMLNNCGGGTTPWGTLLTAEENFNQYFAHRNAMPAGPVRDIHTRYGLTTGNSERGWEIHETRFDLRVEPNEPFRFGYIVEIDPYDASFVPKKRTALGRLKHEAATCGLTGDGRVAVYSGDDERFEHVYKFVSAQRVSNQREANFGLLDEGTLYAARFEADGTGQWLPLLPGVGALATWTMADILINTRQAALLLGATRMDRPEDLQLNPRNGKLYCAMTNNTNRTAGGASAVDAANPRPNNRHGHVIELTESGDDPGSLTFRWEIFMLCGDPANPADEPTYFAGFDKTQVSAISCPDNITFDKRGNLWIATDGQINTFNRNDGIFAVPVDGPDRGYVRQFLSGVPGGECASLALTPDDETLFVSIQHPAEGSSIAAPTHRWPDGLAPRPTVIAVRKGTPSNPTIGS
jgi:secreted PhoX family phosphatase